MSQKKPAGQYVRKKLLDIKPYPATITSAQLAEYAGLELPEILKLNNFENPMMEGFYTKTTQSAYYAYPDPLSLNLRKALANYTGFSSDWIACGNGSDELIDQLLSLLVDNGEEILICPPTFPMYEVYAHIREIPFKKVIRNQDLSLNLQDIQRSISGRTKIIFIDSPGNPAGNVISKGDIAKLLKNDLIVVVDEAYYEYCGMSAAGLIKDHSNLIVLRTFSKWAGLAGMRIGYMLADPAITERLLATKSPYNVNAAAQEAALFALDHQAEFLGELKKLTSYRDYMVEKLSGVPGVAKVIPGQAAFVTVKLDDAGCGEVAEALKKQGILIKPVTQPRLENSLLVGLTNLSNTDRLAAELTKLLEDKDR